MESVGRNQCIDGIDLALYVALRMESVGRNRPCSGQRGKHRSSLSAWRAWVEMQIVPSKMAISARRSPHGERG